MCVWLMRVTAKYSISKNECFDSDRASLTAASVNNGRMNVEKTICTNINVSLY